MTSTSTDEHVIGCVKWFNKKSGYGFITIVEGTHLGKDIFVHHSGVTVGKDQYKYLIQGEYVQVNVISGASTDKHEHQSSNVTGIKGGKLMCETRNDLRTSSRKFEEIVVEEKEEAPFVTKQRKPRVQKPAASASASASASAAIPVAKPARKPRYNKNKN